ncbi:MAG: XdhC family protein [Lachnospiraceae bacterium]|nr:XdhC family protein [Lachnospiraceae bacterium]
MDYKKFYSELLKRLKYDGRVPIRTVLEGDERGTKYFCAETEKYEDHVCYESVRGRMSAVICGGGHIALALAPILKSLDYHVIIIDSRAAFADQKRFPMADEVICMDYEEALMSTALPQYASYIIVTSGHKFDYVCLKTILKNRSFFYVGMIGSRTKVASNFADLRRDGIDEALISKVHAPIGLPIGGQLPSEIAVSIAAQLIQIKSESEQHIIETEVAQGILQQEEDAVMVSIIEKNDSSPRGKGSRMVVTESGKVYGSVGGGAIEFEAIQYAETLCGKEAFDVRNYDLSGAGAKNLGMICGGKVKLMFESLLKEK